MTDQRGDPTRRRSFWYKPASSLVLPPGFGSTLEVWYDADNPGASNEPVDRGLQGLGSMAAVNTTPTYGASDGPSSLGAWTFDRTGRWADADSSSDIDTDTFTIAFVVRIIGTDVVQDIGAFRPAGAVYTRAIVSGGTVRYRLANSGEVNTGDAVDSEWHVVVSHYDGTSDQIHFAVLGNTSGSAGAAGTYDSSSAQQFTQMGGENADELNGKVAQMMLWSEIVDEAEIYAWAKEKYGL